MFRDSFYDDFLDLIAEVWKILVFGSVIQSEQNFPKRVLHTVITTEKLCWSWYYKPNGSVIELPEDGKIPHDMNTVTCKKYINETECTKTFLSSVKMYS